MTYTLTAIPTSSSAMRIGARILGVKGRVGRGIIVGCITTASCARERRTRAYRLSLRSLSLDEHFDLFFVASMPDERGCLIWSGSKTVERYGAAGEEREEIFSFFVSPTNGSKAACRMGWKSVIHGIIRRASILTICSSARRKTTRVNRRAKGQRQPRNRADCFSLS